jgi:hypothetical protein
LNSAKLTEPLRKGLWAQCAELTSRLKNIIVDKATDKSAAEKAYGKTLIGSKILEPLER